MLSSSWKFMNFCAASWRDALAEVVAERSDGGRRRRRQRVGQTAYFANAPVDSKPVESNANSDPYRFGVRLTKRSTLPSQWPRSVARPLALALPLERVDQLGDERLVHRADGVGRPFLDGDRHGPIRDRGAIGALEVGRRVELLDLVRVELRDLIHPVVEHHDVRVVVDAPDVRLAVAPFVGARAVGPEVRDAVDGVGILLLVRHLHAAPQVLADVELEAVNLGLVRQEHVLRREERRPRVPGIVVGVGQPGRQAVAIFRAAQDLVLLIPVAVDADVPLARVLVLVRG